MPKDIWIDNESDVRAALLSKDLHAVHVSRLYEGLEDKFDIDLVHFRQFAKNSIFFSEGDTHKRLKSLANAASRLALSRNKSTYPEIAKGIFGSLARRVRVNLAEDYSNAFVNAVVIQSLGLNPRGLDEYHRWRSNIEWLLADVPPWREVKHFNASAKALQGSLLNWFAADDGNNLRASGFDTLVEERSINDLALVLSALLLGSIATSYTITNALCIVLASDRGFSEWRQAFARDTKDATDRLIAVSSAVPDVTRVCASGALFADRSVAVDQRVTLNLMPDMKNRSKSPGNIPDHSLSFGAGRHKCVGEGMAREMVAVALTTIFETGERVELAADDIVVEQSHPLGRIVDLPVVVHAPR